MRETDVVRVFARLFDSKKKALFFVLDSFVFPSAQCSSNRKLSHMLSGMRSFFSFDAQFSFFEFSNSNSEAHASSYCWLKVRWMSE